MKHSPPEYHAKSFVCPHCGVYAQQDWFEQLLETSVARCVNCKEITIWYNEALIYPIASIAPQSTSDMPEDVAVDFNEARLVLAFSPRSSAALLRLCLEKLCIYLKLPGKNLNEQIGAMVKEGLSPKVQKALDIVRVIGNNAVHPGSINLQDDKQTAFILFDLINIIVEQKITVPRMIDETYDTLPQGALEQIEKRDNTKTHL